MDTTIIKKEEERETLLARQSSRRFKPAIVWEKLEETEKFQDFMRS